MRPTLRSFLDFRAARGALLSFLFAVSFAGSASAQTPGAPTVTETSLELSDGSILRYGIAVPSRWDPSDRTPRPLVLALHPGGSSEYFGSSFMQSIIEPGLRAWNAVIVAPDAPNGTWTSPSSERIVLALIERVMAEYPIDRARVLVTGHSMGGRGSWFFVGRHPEIFTGAIVMAGSAIAADIAEVEDPVYMIHSPDDEVVSFEIAEQAYYTLNGRNHPVELRVLPGVGHYMMAAYVPALRVAAGWMQERWASIPR